MINKPLLRDIQAGKGLGDLKFGMDRDAVKALLGEPDEKEQQSYSEDGSDNSESWHYDSLELSLSFDEEDDWRLVTIAVTSRSYQLDGLQPIRLTKEQLEEELEAIGVTDFVFEDHSTDESPSHELLASDSLAMNFWFDEDKCSEVQWGPFYNEDDSVIWPG